MLLFFLFFFKQKTAYELRISDWSSDVCSSDLAPGIVRQVILLARAIVDGGIAEADCGAAEAVLFGTAEAHLDAVGGAEDRRKREAGRHVAGMADVGEIGRASCRERVCKYV